MEAPMEHPIVAEAVKNDQDALAFLRAIARVLHFWDDLIDRDQPISDTTINAVMWSALIELPVSPFFVQNMSELRPMLAMAIINWHAANDLERQAKASRDDKMIAFVIRSTYVDLLTMSALIIGGPEWAQAHAAPIRRWAHSEGFPGYLKNLAAEAAARRTTDVLFR